MEVSEHSKVQNSLKEETDDTEKVEVEKVDVSEVIQHSPESVSKQDESVAVEVTEVDKKEIVEKSGSSEVTLEKKEVEKLSVVSDTMATPEKKEAEKLSVVSDPEATLEKKEVEKSSVVSEPEAPQKEVVSSEFEQKQEESHASVDGASAVASETETKTLEVAALLISDKNVVETSGVAESVCKENVVDSSKSTAVPRGGADSITENQRPAILTPHTRTSWMNCCGLFDAFRHSNQ